MRTDISLLKYLFLILCIVFLALSIFNMVSFVVTIVSFLLLYSIYRSKNLTSILSNDIKSMEMAKNIVNSLPFPYAIVSKNEIISCNDQFKNAFGGNKLINKLVSTYKLQPGLQFGTVLNNYYSIYTEEIKAIKETDKHYFVSFVKKDGTNCEKVIVALIFIDNYEEVTEQMTDIRVPLLVALIDKKLNELAKQVGGIVRKYEKDKYLFIFTEEKLEYLKENKFQIQESIRDIEMGNKIPVTISIGIGKDGHTINQSMEYAKAAIDLALGRGGDQVLIKERDKYLFFGGKSAEVEQKSRVRARVKANALSELIYEASQVIVMGHRNADLDSLGSAIGIYKIVTHKGKKCKIILNSVSTSINLLYERLIEKKEYKEDVFIINEEAINIIDSDTLIIVVDCHISNILECPELLNLNNNIVVIDHHRKSTDFISNHVLSYHEPYASSTSELVTELIQYTDGIVLDNVEADSLLGGITVDTKSFTFKTGAKTFEAAAFLKRHGADGIRIRMLLQYDLESYKARSIAVNNAEIYKDNIAITICPSNVENPSLTSAQAADELLTISKVNASFVVCGDDNMVLISARSLHAINVQIIMEKFGGGGHQTIAGAQILDMTVDEVLSKLKNIISEYLEGNE